MIIPTCTAGDIAQWKKAQNSPKKSIISEAINNKKPAISPLLTTIV